MRFSRVIAGLIAVLASCGAPPDERVRVSGVLQDERSAAPQTPVSAAPTPLLQREAQGPAPVVTAKPAPPPTPAAATPSDRRARPTPRASGSETARPPPPPEPKEPPVAAIDPARLVGLGRSELANLMGTPMILRNEPPGELWLYKNAACVAHVYLYENAGHDDYEVRYVETRGHDDAVSSAQCLAAFADDAASTVSLNDND